MREICSKCLSEIHACDCADNPFDIEIEEEPTGEDDD